MMGPWARGSEGAQDDAKKLKTKQMGQILEDSEKGKHKEEAWRDRGWAWRNLGTVHIPP